MRDRNWVMLPVGMELTVFVSGIHYISWSGLALLRLSFFSFLSPAHRQRHSLFGVFRLLLTGCDALPFDYHAHLCFICVGRCSLSAWSEERVSSGESFLFLHLHLLSSIRHSMMQIQFTIRTDWSA